MTRREFRAIPISISEDVYCHLESSDKAPAAHPAWKADCRATDGHRITWYPTFRVLAELKACGQATAILICNYSTL